jgi:hypothetical protein
MSMQIQQIQFNEMLLQSGNDTPKNVLKTISFFQKNKIWYKLSRNKDAFGCEDAAKKRNRNNSVGIPSSDELKTFFGEYTIETNKNLLLLNLPGDCKIDFVRVRNILGIKEHISLAGEQAMKLFNIERWKVNPFLIYEMYEPISKVESFANLTTLFDKSLLHKEETAMTNAGELSWGIEFHVSDVVKHFQNCIYSQSFIETK